MDTTTPPMFERLAVFDTETTGINVYESRIVTAAIAVIEGDKVVERYDWIINPGVEIPEKAIAVHGVTNEVAQASGMDPAAGIEQIVTTLKMMLERGLPIVAFNASFDLTLLRSEAARYGIEWITDLSPIFDPFIIDRWLDRYRRGKRQLTLVAEHYGVALGDDAHDAGADALAAGFVLQKIAAKFSAKLPDSPAELHAAQVSWAAELAAGLEEFLQRKDPQARVNRGWPLQADS